MKSMKQRLTLLTNAATLWPRMMNDAASACTDEICQPPTTYVTLGRWHGHARLTSCVRRGILQSHGAGGHTSPRLPEFHGTVAW